MIKSIFLVCSAFLNLSLLSQPELITQDFFKNSINWTKLTLSVPTKEKIPKIITDTNQQKYATNFAYNISEARNQAMSLAKEKINLQTVRSLEQIQFDNNYTLGKKIEQSLAFRERFNQFILKENLEYKIKIQEDELFAEGLIYFQGKDGLFEALLQEYDSEKFPEFSNQTFISTYTGLILDARHLEANPALFPKILTDKGLEIYSSRMVNKNMAIDKGLVSYHVSLEEAIKDPRIGKKPFIVLALTSLGKNKTDFSIPTSEAKKLLGSNQTLERLKRCAVIILLDLNTLQYSK